MELLVLILAGMAVVAHAQTGGRDILYEYFDDYLLTMAAPKEHNSVLKDETSQETSAPESSADESSASSDSSEGLTYQDILGYFRDVPREHWSCCMLGMLAGNKGFHCNAAFYAARVATRNTNRAHNRHLPFHGRDRIPMWGREIMHTFSRCVLNHSEDFHTCCYAATVERRERVRWQQYRQYMLDDIPLEDSTEQS